MAFRWGLLGEGMEQTPGAGFALGRRPGGRHCPPSLSVGGWSPGRHTGQEGGASPTPCWPRTQEKAPAARPPLPLGPAVMALERGPLLLLPLSLGLAGAQNTLEVPVQPGFNVQQVTVRGRGPLSPAARMAVLGAEEGFRGPRPAPAVSPLGSRRVRVLVPQRGPESVPAPSHRPIAHSGELLPEQFQGLHGVTWTRQDGAEGRGEGDRVSKGVRAKGSLRGKSASRKEAAHLSPAWCDGCP